MSALAGCKILRELSKLEDETESKLEMKKLAQKFEDLAHGTNDHERCLSAHLLRPSSGGAEPGMVGHYAQTRPTRLDLKCCWLEMVLNPFLSSDGL